MVWTGVRHSIYWRWESIRSLSRLSRLYGLQLISTYTSLQTEETHNISSIVNIGIFPCK
jgi:hypothetical protein